MLSNKGSKSMLQCDIEQDLETYKEKFFLKVFIFCFHLSKNVTSFTLVESYELSSFMVLCQINSQASYFIYIVGSKVVMIFNIRGSGFRFDF
jgi:hypothetical protein